MLIPRSISEREGDPDEHFDIGLRSDCHRVERDRSEVGNLIKLEFDTNSLGVMSVLLARPAHPAAMLFRHHLVRTVGHFMSIH